MGNALLMRGPRLRPFEGTADPGYQALKRRIIARTGHDYYEDKDDLLWERLRRRLIATGLKDCSAYLERLDSAAGEKEWSALASEITIGETFFFRYAEQFAALSGRILPDIIARNRESRRIRIWSAGCSTGAEPYSIAILLKNIMGEDIADWRITILGTDIDEQALAIARSGVFSPWALRALTPDDRERYFTTQDGPGVRRYALKPQYRSMVRFEQQNLMDFLRETAPLQFSEFDLVLCRNVLIYFSLETGAAIVRRLGGSLSPQGWLLLGHAEPNPAFTGFLSVENLPGTVAYRPPGLKAPSEPATEAPGPAPARPAAKAPARPRMPARRPAAATPAPAAPQPAQASLDLIKAQADRGDLAGARSLLDAALLASPLDARLHFYDGLVRLGSRDVARAEAALRRALFLDKDFAMAHYQLGLLMLDSGRLGQARRSLTNAAHAVARMAADDPVPEGDGLMAGELVELVRATLDPAGQERA